MTGGGLILASRSPRRLEYIRSLGIEFSVDAPDIHEVREAGELACDYALRIAREKCRTVAARRPQAAVLAADTVVVLGEGAAEKILEKPADEADACRMLGELQGQTHRVLTGFCLLSPGGDELSRVVSSDVEFVPLTRHEIERYVVTGEPLDKAGAYAIQGGAARFVRSVRGSYTNIVGLPLAEVCDALRTFDLFGGEQNERGIRT